MTHESKISSFIAFGLRVVLMAIKTFRTIYSIYERIVISTPRLNKIAPVLPVHHVAFLIMIIKLELEVLGIREGEPRGATGSVLGSNAFGPDRRKEQPIGSEDLRSWMAGTAPLTVKNFHGLALSVAQA